MLASILNVLFFVFHTGLIMFIMTGWAFGRTRLVHLWTVGVVLVCWVGLGFWYGFGYCPCTEWHWQVLERLGHRDLPSSYTKLLLDQLTGLNSNAGVVDVITVGAFAVVSAASALLNYRDYANRDGS